MTSDELKAMQERATKWRMEYGQYREGYGKLPAALLREHENDFNMLLTVAKDASHLLDTTVNAHLDAVEALERQGRITHSLLTAWDSWEKGGLQGEPPLLLIVALDDLRPVVPVTQQPVTIPQPVSVGW